MTERLYYTDSYVTAFTAVVTRVEGNHVYLDRTAFYPTSGGQPFDTGTLGGARVVDVADEVTQEGEAIGHTVEGALPAIGSEVIGNIDWDRRWDHMQQHTGQHLLSAALEGLYGIGTVSFHLGAEASTIDVDTPSMTSEQIRTLELRANALIQENRTLAIGYEDAATADGLRKASERQGTLRIISIDNLDRSACGGTHVRATGEIGVLLIRKLEKIRNTTRIEFLCGQRAVQRARMDYDALSAAARSFSAPLDQVPALVAAQVARITESEKVRQRLELALAVEAGRTLYRAKAPAINGIRLIVENVSAMDDTVRSRSQGFVEGGRAAYLATCASGPSYLLAASADLANAPGMGAQELVKPLLASLGGKGSGSPALAQGRLADPENLIELERLLRNRMEA